MRMRTILPEQENPILRQKATVILPSDIESSRIQEIIRDMKSLLAKEGNGVALAAPQVGESLRIFIVSGRALVRHAEEKISDEPEKNDTDTTEDQVYINPEVVKVSRLKKKKHEGCLSIRGQWGVVRRAEKMTVRAYNEHGERITRGASGFLAHIFQHELDHLEGVLYTDKAVELYDDKATD